MATLPPPYSQRDAARAQRYYQRSLRRPSMLGPLVLIVVGVIALLVETNKLNACPPVGLVYALVAAAADRRGLALAGRMVAGSHQPARLSLAPPFARRPDRAHRLPGRPGLHG